MPKFTTPQEEKAYKLGQLDGMLTCQQHVIRNLKNEYEKLYQKRQEMEKSDG